MRFRFTIFSVLCLFLCFSPAWAGTEAGAVPDTVLSDRFAGEIQQIGRMVGDSAYGQVFSEGPALLSRVRTEFPDGSFDETKILDFLVNAYYRSGRVMDPEAIALGQRALLLKETLIGPESPELAISLLHMGNLYTRRWEADKALVFFDRALVILETVSPDFDLLRATALSGKGVALRRLARNLEALELYGQALAIQERLLGPDHPDVASTLNNQAVVLAERGDYSRAAELDRRALAIREKHFGPDHEWVAESVNNLANHLGYLGKYDEALALGERAVQIFADQLGTDHQRYWFARQNLGITYLDMGDFPHALPLLEGALEGLRSRFGPESPNLCYTLDAVGSCRFEMGEYGPALASYSESLHLAERAFGEGSYETADTITQQGKCLVALERLDEALERLELSLAIWKENLPEDNAMLCDLFNRLAELQMKRGDFTQALLRAERSYEIGCRDLGKSHPLQAVSSLLAGRACLGLGKKDEALAWALQAEDISRTHLQQTMYVLSERLALDYAASRVKGLDLALSVLRDGETGERVIRVWDALIRSRSVVLDEYTARNRLLRDRDDPVIAALQDSSLVLRERLANLALRGPGWEDLSVYHGILRETDADLRGVERQLSLHSAIFRTWKEDHQTGYAKVAEALPPGSILAAFARCRDEAGRESYKVFLLDADDPEPRVVDLGDAGRIDAAVATWRDQATFGRKAVEKPASNLGPGTVTRGFVKIAKDSDGRLAAYIEAGETLRRLVWDPAAGSLDRPGSIFLVADGSLHLMSFPSLPAVSGGFLVETGSLMHVLTSEKTLVRREERAAVPGKLLALGGPDYGPASGRSSRQQSPATGSAGATLAGQDFPSLPYAQAEVEAIGRFWTEQGGRTTLLVGAAASEDNLKRNLSRVQVLHLATHGFFQPLAGSGGRSPGTNNPLTRSGLVLADANQRQQASGGGSDGILSAEEVAALDLAGVQWAVLSACDTGLGELKTRGEGVFGLRRVFTLAGARTVIMSLWPVDDESSSSWMKALYRGRWRDGLSTAAAMRQASLDVLSRRRAAGRSVHPYYWAGFVAAGDWR